MAEFERELGWDDEIEKDGSDFILLPAGDYDFTVTAFERGRYEGGAKLPACNKAIISIHIVAPEGEVTLSHNLFLHTKTEGLLSEFFCAIGQKKHGEKLKMNWQAVIGSRGRCKVAVRDWTGNDGENRKSNEIKKFYEPESNTAAQQPVQYAQPQYPQQPQYAQQPVQQQYVPQPQQQASQYAPAPAPGGVYTPGKF